MARRRGEPFPLDRPLGLVGAEAGIPRLVALNAMARDHGLRCGMALADARAALPALAVRDAEPWTDAAALGSLALWCRRWSPRTAPDGTDGLLLDITGCAHLWGGEAALAADVRQRLERLGFTVAVAVAGRQLAAWAWARLGGGGVLADEAAAAALAALPVRALRIAPETAAALGRLGFRQVAELAALPRATLARRFGRPLVARLEELLGDGEVPFTPATVPPCHVAEMSFAEPIGRTEDILATARRLAWQQRVELERAGVGWCRAGLTLQRVDGRLAAIEVGLGRPSRDAAHLVRLLAMRLEGLDVGFGIERVALAASATAPLPPEQTGLQDAGDGAELARLTDRLVLRLGAARVARLEPVASHLPERAMALLPPEQAPRAATWPARRARPLRLHARPRAVQVIAPLPDGPPLRVRDGRTTHRVLRATGPERILPEWWRVDSAGQRPRDYWRAVLDDGRTVWLRRDGTWGDPVPPAWSLHGTFG